MLKNTRRSLSRIVVLVLLLSLIGAALPAAAQQVQLPILVVNTGALNVRSGPGPQYTVITTVRGGTELPVLGTDPSGTWNLVATAAGNGWVDISFTLPRGDFRFVPTINPTAAVVQAAPTPVSVAIPLNPNPPVPELEAPQFVVNTGALNVRTGPGAGFTRIGSVPGGTVLFGLATTPDGAWVLVESPIGRGWIDPEFTLIRGFFSNMPVVSY